MTLALTQPYELKWGTIVLDSKTPTTDPWLCQAMGVSLGNAVPVVEVIESLLDGDLSVVTSYGNREIQLVLRLSALDGEALAQAEATLMREVTALRPSPLTWTPPTIGSWPAVFDVVTARLDPSFDEGWDIKEKLWAYRYYTLTLECLPWSHPENTVVIPALEVPSDPEGDPVSSVIDTCSVETSRWARKTGVSTGTAAWTNLTGPTALSDGLRVTGKLPGGDSSTGWLMLERTDSVSMTGTPYLYLDVRYSVTVEGWGTESALSVRFDGVIADPVAVAPTSDPNIHRYFFEAPASFETLLIRLRVERSSWTATVVLHVYEVGRTDRLGIDGTAGFQVARTAVIGGSAPTQAAIRFDAGESPLVGSTALIYTGSSPAIPMRQFLASSALPDVDASMISGASNDLTEPMVFRVPTTQFTRANYTLLARFSFTGSRTFHWSARLVSAAGATMPGSEVVESGAMLCVNPTSDPWRVHALAEIPMPIVAIEGDVTHAVEITLEADASWGGLVDELWLLDTDNGAVTVIHEPSTNQLTAIELRSPQLDAPQPAVIGTWQTYGTQDISRLVTLFGTHQLRPGMIHIFTATDLARFAAVTLEYYERFNTYPGPAIVSEDDGG